MPPIAPSTKPGRRPNRCMKVDSGVAVSIEPTTSIVIGSVARQGFGASICPASPPTMKLADICAPRIACAATRTVTLRRARMSEAADDMGSRLLPRARPRKRHGAAPFVAALGLEIACASGQYAMEYGEQGGTGRLPDVPWARTGTLRQTWQRRPSDYE
jgi:hypothetical protein